MMTSTVFHRVEVRRLAAAPPALVKQRFNSRRPINAFISRLLSFSLSLATQLRCCSSSRTSSHGGYASPPTLPTFPSLFPNVLGSHNAARLRSCTDMCRELHIISRVLSTNQESCRVISFGCVFIEELCNICGTNVRSSVSIRLVCNACEWFKWFQLRFGHECGLLWIDL